MESWQIRHIDDNLSALLDNITCNVKLLSHLKTFKILSDYEVDLIRAIKTHHDKSSQLLDYVKTRKLGYEALKKALTETRQSGALEILETATYSETERRESNPSSPSCLGTQPIRDNIAGPSRPSAQVPGNVRPCSESYGRPENSEIADKAAANTNPELQKLLTPDSQKETTDGTANEDESRVIKIIDRDSVSYKPVATDNNNNPAGPEAQNPDVTQQPDGSERTKLYSRIILGALIIAGIVVICVISTAAAVAIVTKLTTHSNRSIVSDIVTTTSPATTTTHSTPYISDIVTKIANELIIYNATDKTGQYVFSYDNKRRNGTEVS